MAKVKRKMTAPEQLTMRLFEPGMTLLHRAGLGGLVCTLRYLEQAREQRQLPAAGVAGSPGRDEPPWEIDEQSVTLRFGKPEKAGDFLEQLFQIAFQIKDGLIYLPGQYAEEPSQAVRAELQNGLVLTFLQHGKVRKLAKEATAVSFDPEGNGIPGVVVEFKACESFKHQDGWRHLVDGNGCLTSKPQRVDGPIFPGAVVRHVAYTGPTAAEDTPGRLLPLYFAIVGCLALPVNRATAALIVPEVENLLDFEWFRPPMTPTTARSCHIASAADGALQAQVRLRSHEYARNHQLPGCYAMTFRPTPWASQQKSRVATISVPPTTDRFLDRFEKALAALPVRIQTTKSPGSGVRGKKKCSDRVEAFRIDSIVRPLVADNLAVDRPWYAGFVRLMKTLDANGKPLHQKLRFEKKGLQAMTDDSAFWDNAGEAAVVRAVHEALRKRYGKIAGENKNSPVAMKKRFEAEYDRWRLAFVGAKTADQFRKGLCDLFSRAGSNSVLRESWSSVLPMLDANRWQLTRDLALLGLASYTGKGESEEAEHEATPAAA